MFELRWVVFGPNRQLEYRHAVLVVDASGALCPSDQWSNWIIVPKVDGTDAAFEDVQASGGIADLRE